MQTYFAFLFRALCKNLEENKDLFFIFFPCMKEGFAVQWGLIFVLHFFALRKNLKGNRDYFFFFLAWKNVECNMDLFCTNA